MDTKEGGRHKTLASIEVRKRSQAEAASSSISEGDIRKRSERQRSMAHVNSPTSA